MLYIVATPIGNLQDITLRALETLKTVDFIVCEDTRHTAKLLFHFAITKPLVSFHAHSTQKDIDKIISLLHEGKQGALVCDAGTPGISDPGFLLIQACHERHIATHPIPGASAFLTALMASGLPINRFWYYGFLPAKKGRQTLFRQFAEHQETIVFYESPHRLLKTLEALSLCVPHRKMVIARELTKLHEEFVQGTVLELYTNFMSRSKILGEFVMILAPSHDESAAGSDEKDDIEMQKKPLRRVKRQKYESKT